MERFTRQFYFIIALVSLLLGTLGAFLPLLPTTPFVLLAAFCFSKSSEKCHSWLLQHKLFGPMLQNWEEYGAINLKTKKTATALIFVAMTLTLVFGKVPLWGAVGMIIILLAVLAYIWSRPSRGFGN